MRATHPEPFEAAVYVDTGPIQERVYAQYAGIGWIGKHTCVISAKRGSWIFLSTILCSLPLDAGSAGDRSLRHLHASASTRARPARSSSRGCSTRARCLSYLTIEQKKAIPPEHAARAGAHVYGCDICQDVCPWNQAPLVSGEPQWLPRPALDAPRLVDLWRASRRGSRLKRSPAAR